MLHRVRPLMKVNVHKRVTLVEASDQTVPRVFRSKRKQRGGLCSDDAVRVKRARLQALTSESNASNARCEPVGVPSLAARVFRCSAVHERRHKMWCRASVLLTLSACSSKLNVAQIDLNDCE